MPHEKMAQDLVTALAEADPNTALHAALRRRLDTGGDRVALTAEVTAAMLANRKAGNERVEDLLLGALDMLSGWTAPAWKLPPTSHDIRER